MLIHHHACYHLPSVTREVARHVSRRHHKASATLQQGHAGGSWDEVVVKRADEVIGDLLA